jgi:hypothetical protein
MRGGARQIKLRLTDFLRVRRQLLLQLSHLMPSAGYNSQLLGVRRFILIARDNGQQLSGFDGVTFADRDLLNSAGPSCGNVHGVPVDAATHEK